MVWLEFFICSALLTFFAYNLCKEGVIISEKTHIEEGVIGMVFLSIATSFPEIITGGTAVFHLGKIGLGYGDIIGSVMVNLMILVFIDYFSGGGRVLAKVSKLNRATGIFIVGVLLALLFSGLLRSWGVKIPNIGRIGSESLPILAAYFTYLIIMKKRGFSPRDEIYKVKDEPFWKIWAKFGAFLITVMVLSIWMARIGEKIVLSTSLSQTFTGTLFLGIATSLPEIIVSFAALKVSSIEMAVGNVLGSNLFDVCVIPFFDFLSTKPIMGMLTPGQILATGIALILSTIAAVGLIVKRTTNRRINIDTGLIFVIGLIGFVLLYYVK